jgi:hypothetical protein
MEAWSALEADLTTDLPSEEFIGLALQGITGLDTLKGQPGECKYSVEGAEGVR